MVQIRESLSIEFRKGETTGSTLIQMTKCGECLIKEFFLTFTCGVSWFNSNEQKSYYEATIRVHAIKAALTNLTKNLKTEYCQQGIRDSLRNDIFPSYQDN